MAKTKVHGEYLDPSVISGQTQVTAVGADSVLILDATDNSLKKALLSDVIETIDGGAPTFTTATISGSNPVLNIARTSNYTYKIGSLANDTFAIQSNETTDASYVSLIEIDSFAHQGSSPAIKVDSSGNVGIGGSPGAKLDVNTGTVNTLAHFHSTDDNAFIELKDDDTTGYIGVQNDYVYVGGAPSTNTQNLVIHKTSGKVGIGTTSPLDALHISSAVSSDYRGNLFLDDSTTGFAAGVGGQITFGAEYRSNGDHTEWAAIQGAKANSTDANYAGTLEFKTRAHGGALQTKMVLDDSGNLGIGTASPASLLHIESATNTAITIQAGTNSSASLRLKNDAVDFDVNVQTNDNWALYNHTYNKQPVTVSPQGYMTLQHEGTDFGLQIRTNGTYRSGLVIDKPNTSTILGSLLVLSDESYRMGTASHYHMVMLQNGQTTLYGDDSAVQLGVDGTGLFSNKNRYRFTDTTGGEHEVRTGGRNGTGTYTLFTNGASNTQSAGIVEVWGIYGTPSNASYTKYVISGNRNIATVISEVETGSVPSPTVAWSGSALQVSNSNSSLYYHVRVELHDIGISWSATWGNFPGFG